MLEVFNLLLNGMVASFVCFYASSKLLKEKINYKSINFWLIVAINTIFVALIYTITVSVVKVIINYTVLAILNKFLFKKNIVKILLSSFITIFLFVISEMIYTISIISLFNLSIEEFKQLFFANLGANIVIALLVCLMVNIKKTMIFFDKSLYDIQLKAKTTSVLLLLLSILTLAILLYYIYFEVSLVTGMFFNLILVGMYMLLILNLFKEKNDNTKLQIKQELLINNLNEYEKMLELQRINNHENKNYLIAIKGMLDNKNGKIKEYIDEVIKTKQTDDHELLCKTNKLPIGGLQGLIYQKLLAMKDKNIASNLEVSKTLNKLILEEINVETYKHLCTIVGVELDNAIEAVENLTSKSIGICVYNDTDSFVITISNNFEGKIELDKIDNKGYSTKGKGRGYGLCLVKRILDKSNNLTLEREIIGNIFKQVLKIKI